MTDLTLENLVLLNRSATIARLLSGVAHDVNNALQVIGGSVELLDDLALPDAAVTRIARIRTQHARAATVVQDLLAFARESPEGAASISVRDFVARALSLRAFSVSRAGLTLAFDAPDGQSFTVKANRMQLQQAVLNLIGNAEQSLAGKSGGAITVTLAVEHGLVVIRVADNGPGVPIENRERIFEPFFTTRPKADASGLGLTVARTIAGQYGGSLVLEPLESGATFALRLPSVS